MTDAIGLRTSRVVAFEDGRTVTVLPATILMSMKKSRLTDEQLKADLGNDEAGVLLLVFYPSMAACSTGDVPTPEEFLQLPDTDANEWYEACKEVNPHWWPEPGMILPTEGNEKKRRPRKRQPSNGGEMKPT